MSSKRRNAAKKRAANKRRRISSPEASAAESVSESSSAPVQTLDRRARVEDVDEDDDDDIQIIEEPVMDAEAQLKELQKRWTAPCYAFYQENVYVEYRDGRLCHVFTCVKCKKALRRFQDKGDASSTSNLRTHVNTCWGCEALEEAEKAGNVEAARPHILSWVAKGTITAIFGQLEENRDLLPAAPLSPMETRVEQALWVARSMRPLSIIEDPGLRRLLKAGRPDYPLMLAKTLGRDVLRIFRYGCGRIIKLLKGNPSKIHVQTDAWTAPNHRAYVAIYVSCEREGKRVRTLLEIREVPEGHSGEVLARELEASLNKYEITEKLLAVVADNASANDAMVDELAELIDDFPGPEHQVRCFAHILNLVAKTIISQFDAKPGGKATTAEKASANAAKQAAALAEIIAGLDLESEMLPTDGGGVDDEDDEIIEGEELDDVEDDVDGWIDERKDLSEEEKDELRQNVLPVKLVLAKLRKLAHTITNSSTKLLPAWKKLLASLKKAIRIMPRDVATRWNSTFIMLSFAIEHRVAIDKFTADRDWDLRALEVEDEEWKLATQLRDVLKIFWDATQFFSRGDGSPLVTTVIPAIDAIDEALTTYSLDEKYSPAIRAACALGKKTLNRYYSKTDDSALYVLSLILHPSYKLSYFKRLKWLPEWIANANEKARRIWRENYAHRAVEEMPVEAPAAGEAVQPAGNIFDQLMQFVPDEAPSAEQDEYEMYISSPCEDVGGDPLGHWYKTENKQPRLSRMARDYLSAPATTVDVERVFSQGRLLLSHTRNRLGPKMTCALMCVGEWSRAGFLDTKEIARVLKASDKDQKTEIVTTEADDEKTWANVLRTIRLNERRANGGQRNRQA